MIVAFTGHRPDEIGGFQIPNPTYNNVCQQLEATLRELKPEKALSGMALGVDQWAANICIKLGIPFVAVTPFAVQDAIWPLESKRIFKILLGKAAEVVTVSEGGFTAAKMQVRNEYLVDNCDTLIAIWKGDKSGGTYNCIKYAEEVKKKIIYITP